MTSHRYRSTTTEIDAFQFTKKARWAEPSGWPEWLREAWNRPIAEAGSLYPTNDGRFFIRTHKGPQAIAYNDWIIREPDGRLRNLKPDVFEAAYDHVPEAALDPEGHEGPSLGQIAYEAWCKDQNNKTPLAYSRIGEPYRGAWEAAASAVAGALAQAEIRKESEKRAQVDVGTPPVSMTSEDPLARELIGTLTDRVCAVEAFIDGFRQGGAELGISNEGKS